MKLWGGIFLAGFGADLMIGWHGVAALAAGHLAGPDSALRIARILAGIHQNHLVNSVNGVTPEWSRALDILLWLLATPFALILGWPRALFAAAATIGPLGAGGLSVALAYAIQPYAEDRLLWTACAVTALPLMQGFAAPGAADEHALALALTAASIGCANRAWRGGAGHGFLAGIAGGFAVWLTPVTVLFVLLGFAPLLVRWARKPIGGTLTATASGFIDVIGFAWMVDPVPGGYLALDSHRLSAVYVVLGIFLLLAGAALWRLQSWLGASRWRGLAGFAVYAVFILAWLSLFPQILKGVIPALSVPSGLAAMLGLLACVYALWRGVSGKAPFWCYLGLCILLAVALGAPPAPLAGFAAVAAPALLPAALSQLRARFRTGAVGGIPGL